MIWKTKCDIDKQINMSSFKLSIDDGIISHLVLYEVVYYNSYIDNMKCYQWYFILVYHVKSIVNNDSIRNVRVYDRCIVPIEDKQANKLLICMRSWVKCSLPVTSLLFNLNLFPVADSGICLLSLYATYHIEWVVHSKSFARILLLPHN